MFEASCTSVPLFAIIKLCLIEGEYYAVCAIVLYE